jgi:hypothetical protein
MRKSLLSIATLCGSILAVMLAAAPASAQATRTWVSGVGDDANPCSRTAPCKTFAGAISKTAPSGEINVLDPGGFGAVTITKSITISSESFEAGVLVSGTNGIVISAGATDAIILKGLDIEGLGTGLDGIKVLTGLNVYVINCRIHHFINNGINMASTTAGARLVVQNSQVIRNGTLNSVPLTGGINVNGTTNDAKVIDTLVDNNQNFGVQVASGNTGSLIRATVIAGTGTSLSTLAGGTSICFGPSNSISGGVTCTAFNVFK